jgi:septum formation protein
MSSGGTRSIHLILASQSPRRRELLEAAGYEVEVVAPPCPEPEWVAKGLAPAAHAEALAYFKAAAVGRAVGRGLILAGDTVVALGDEVFGKPRDRADARRILTTLAGTTHVVITGLALLDAATGRRLIAHAATRVTMRPLVPELIKAYLDSGEWEGKAGAYGIQDGRDDFIERIDGSFTNVVGLPMELLEQMLAQWDSFA